MSEDVRGRLVTIDGTKLEAKRLWQDPYSHGHRAQTAEYEHSGLGSLTPLCQKPGELLLFHCCYKQSPRNMFLIN